VNAPLFVPDLAALERKLANPPPMLAGCLARFRERLILDSDFRRDHIFLPALLGDPDAIVEARERITLLAADPLLLAAGRPGTKAPAQDTLDNHIWCITPRAMRLAAYFTWLDLHGAWTPDERRIVGKGLLDFFDAYAIPVLRARIPGGHNQQFSMTLCGVVLGHVFAEVEGVADRARALREWIRPKFEQVLGLMPASGYSGEGTTYQSDVVTGLVMWAGVFLEQLGERDIWNRRWTPGGWSFSATLRMEAAMAGVGGLLPPWDHYGWQRVHNLAARTLWAGLSGDASLLRIAGAVWDEKHQLAWRPDDRLWTLLYWPEREGEEVSGAGCRVSGGTLAGWSEPAVGATVEHLSRKLRVMAVWDRCAGNVQGLSREQVNPNHLMVDLDGEPITADGVEDGSAPLFSREAVARTLEAFQPVEQEMIIRQYGSLEAWGLRNQHGFLGASCAVVVDGWESYFPRRSREGRLVFERRDPERHTFAGEAAAYYQPAFDVTRMRRTVSLNAAGITWVVDDLRAPTVHDFTWRIWLRRGARATGPLRVRLDLPRGGGMTFAWLAETNGVGQSGAVSLTTVPSFPKVWGSAGAWPESGSERCDLAASGRTVRFVACLVPEGVEGLAVRRVADGVWEATWEGGSDRFDWPPEIAVLPDPAPVRGEQAGHDLGLGDWDEAPYGLLHDESDALLLAALDDPPVGDWRRTGAAMQTLAVRGNREAMPKIVALLLDARQNYTVHSVAAWCLGHVRYAPALDVLRRMRSLPEVNAAARARWAVERIGQAVSPLERSPPCRLPPIPSPG